MDSTELAGDFIVLAMHDICKPLGNEKDEGNPDAPSNRTGRVIVAEEEDDNDPDASHAKRRILKLVLAPSHMIAHGKQTDRLVVAVEHQRGSMPEGLRLGDRVRFAAPSAVLWMHGMAFLRQGALRSIV